MRKKYKDLENKIANLLIENSQFYNEMKIINSK